MKNKIVKLIALVLLPFLLAGLVSLFVPSYKEFYVSLNKPINLPSIIFPIAWSIIYFLIGIASYLVLMKKGNNKELTIYYIQLFFNVTWTLIFFGFKNLSIALAWTYILLLLVIINSYVFFKVNKLSGLLFIPYIIWTIFATYLTTSTWLLN